MAAPVFETPGAGIAATDDVAVAFPASIAAGDLLFIHCMVKNTPAAVAGSVNPVPTASGFSVLYGPDGIDIGGSTTTSLTSFVMAKLATGSESGTVTLTRPGTTGVFLARMYRVSGSLSDATLANNFEGAAFGSGSDASIEAQSVTTAGAERLVLSLQSIADDNALDAFTGETGGDWTEPTAEFTTMTGNDGAIGVQTVTLASAGTISGGVATMAAADGWVVRAFAIKPAAGGVAGQPTMARWGAVPGLMPGPQRSGRGW